MNDKMFFINRDKQFKSRYDIAKFMEYHIDNYDPLTSNIFHEIKNLRSGGRYTVRGEDGRPDLLSYRIYGNVDYWWIIMLYNSFIKVEQIVNGEEIQFPQLQALESYYFSLPLKQKSIDS